MISLEPVTLEGAHIRLVPLSLSHHPRLCEIGLDAELWQFTTIQVRTAAEMLRYIQTALQEQASGTCLPFVIVEKKHGTIVGTSRYHSLDPIRRRIEIGFTWIAREWQRTPVNTETKYLMLKHAFEELHCVRVEFKANSINERSRQALLRIGAKEEGILRSFVVSEHEGPRDVALFSIIQKDWPLIKTKLELKLDGQQPFVNLDLQQSYDQVAGDYAEEFRNELEHKPFDRKMLDWLVEKVACLGPICDMGCGPGQIAQYLHGQGADTCGIDLSGEMVRQAQLLNPEIRFEQGDMLALEKMGDNSLGGIAAFYSIVHIPRDSVVQALREFKRILRPGGVLLITHHIGTEVVHRDEWFGKDVSLDFLFFETEEMKGYIKSAGLVLEEVIERDPYAGIEYPSRRSYIFARKQLPDEHSN
jgi:RimJ/RimL family protein N-acetyltransferase/SAM-dependent methyltransferase